MSLRRAGSARPGRLLHDRDEPAGGSPAERRRALRRRLAADAEAGDGVADPNNHPDDGFLVVRHMLPSPAFANAIQNVPHPGAEADVLGEYLPAGEYMDRETFEALGCDPSGR